MPPTVPPSQQWTELFIAELLRLKPSMHPAKAADDAAFAAQHMRDLAPDEAAHVWASEKSVD